MAFLKNCLKKAIPALLVLALCLPLLPITAAAEEAGTLTDDLTLIDPNRNGSITVTKYATTGSATGTDATGKETENIPTDTYRRLNGAVFELFKIADATAVLDYYNGINTTEYQISEFHYDKNTHSATYGNSAEPLTPVNTQTTATTATGDGVCVFSNLAVGIYALVEVEVPQQITTPLAVSSLISIPMVNTDTSENNNNAKWMYDIFVYPKNTATATVDLTVYPQGSTEALSGVTYELRKVGETNGQQLTTDQVNNDGKITWDGLSAGQYELVEVSAPDGHVVNKHPLFFKVNANNTITWNEDQEGDYQNQNTNVITHEVTDDPARLSITMRSDKPSLELKVQDNGATDAWVQDTQYAIGKEYSYQLKAFVPENVNELNSFSIQITPGAGITFPDAITVTPEGETALSGGYTWEKTGDGYTLTFITDPNETGNILTDIQGKMLIVTIDAFLNDKAVIASSGNDVKALLLYSKEINGSTESYKLEDHAIVYTYDFEITKYKDSVADVNKLPNVKFKLLKDSANGSEVSLYLDNGLYRPVIDNNETKAEALVTDSNGKIHVKGLEKGTYYLKEIQTVSGYNLLSAPVEMNLNIQQTTEWTQGTAFTDDTYTAHSYSKTTYTLNGNAIDETKRTADIINKKGFTLPRTGSMGYLLFCTVGILLIGGGAMLLFGGRKKKIR